MPAVFKLQNIARFATMFRVYDLLAKRWAPYALPCPYVKVLAGVPMMVRAVRQVSVPIRRSSTA